ncbi:MAG: DPP IV N-terminal domain-containing protein, partial [Bacteroidales bacterium]|nr:DPP IV N-terminal domain-containing protein [Bacteroidales bacterium]
MKNIITTAAALLLAANTLTAQYKEITLNEYLHGYYFPSSVYGLRAMNDGESYASLRYNKLIRYSYATGETIDTLVNFNGEGCSNSHTYMGVNGVSLSADDSKVLFYTIQKPLYRHSFFAFYSVYDRNTKTATPLDANNLVRMASLSTDGNMAAYVSDNNIYVLDLNSNTRTQITSDGETNKILNGVPDWVYEEEFGIAKCYEFSPDGKYLAYIKFDESEVKSYTLPFYETEFANEYKPENNYPNNYEYKYPKVGEQNSKV